MYANHCIWEKATTDYSIYDTSCTHTHQFFSGTPKNNSYKFCPYCGKPLITVYEVTKQLKKEKKTCQI